MSLQSAFTVKLGHKIIPKTVCVGKFDGNRASLAAATIAGKIFMHTPNRQSSEAAGRLITSEASGISLLNINQQVKCLASGRLTSPSTGIAGGASQAARRSSRIGGVVQPAAQQMSEAMAHDVLIIGTPTSVLAYDVYNNSDLFYKELPDGANCIIVGQLGGINATLAICGGNCVIQGFDALGNDLFWTVTGDNVCSLCLCDFDNDGKNELIVGSEDFDIRVFKMDEIIAEMTETESVTNLLSVGGNRFAYALANGTLGVYEGPNRLWRIKVVFKSKNHVMNMHLFDIDGDGVAELITGWSNGKLDFRNSGSGEVLLKEHFPVAAAGIVSADYRMDGMQELICTSIEGEMRGYLPLNQGGVVVQAADPVQEVLRELAMRKQNLLLELSNYEENRLVAQQAEAGQTLPVFDREHLGIIPANTQLQTSLYVNPGSEKEHPCVELLVSTSNDTLVKCVCVFAEGVFPGESHVVHPNQQALANSCAVQLRPDKDLAVDLHVKALVGYKTSVQFHVFELTRQLPKFSMYALCNENAPQPESYVTFKVNERVQRLALWIGENFLLQEDINLKENRLDMRFFSLRGSGMVFIQMSQDGQVTIRCNDMDLAGEIVQAVASYLGVEDLNSTAEFPKEIEQLSDLLEKINGFYSARDQLSADIADRSNLLKGLLIRAEDARLMNDMLNMKKYYAELYNVNQELIAQYKVRCNNHGELLANLKTVNQIIQKAGKLRVGRPKTEVINSCRNAIKEGNHGVLAKIIKAGAGS